MKNSLLDIIRCPVTGSELILKDPIYKNGEIYKGELISSENTTYNYKIVNYIPRLIESENYSSSWGELWKNTATLVRDSSTGDSFYYDCIFGKYSEENKGQPGTSMFGFDLPKDMSGEKILEIGPGTGCCTEHLIKSNAEIISIDMSDAVDTFPEELLTHPKLNVVQGDINSKILKENCNFDRIWLFQVLQHTPSPINTLKQIKRFLRADGELCFTSYKDAFYPWWWIFTKGKSYNFVHKLVKTFLPIKFKVQLFLHKNNLKLANRIWSRLTRPIDPRNIYFKVKTGQYLDSPPGRLYLKHKDEEMLFNLVVLNTHDTITPRYTNGANHKTIRKWTEKALYKNITVWGKSGVRVKAYK